MQKDPAPEFDLQRPFASAVAVMRSVLFSPRSFYLNFKVEGSTKEPAAFVLLVGALSGTLGAALASPPTFSSAISMPVTCGRR
jgi:hypothetical protein